MRYKIITARDVSELEKSVQIYINSGWRPLCAPIFQAGSYSQAMTFEEKKSDLV